MDISTLLFRMGVSTWITDIVTAFPATATNSIQVGKTLPTNVGFIYGISTYADGVDANNLTLPSTTQCQNIFVNFKNGPTVFEEQMRLSDYLNEFAGTPVVRPQKFTQVNIPTFDLSKSSYENPVLFTSITVHLKLWYVDIGDWEGIKKTFTFNPRDPKDVARN